MLENPQANQVFKANNGQDIVRLAQPAADMAPQAREYLQQVITESEHQRDNQTEETEEAAALPEGALEEATSAAE